MSDRVVVITGASRGLGLALAQEFAAHDWQVVGTGRSERPSELPEAAAYHQFDASDAAACESFWKELQQNYPDAQVCLVNNAGAYVQGGLIAAQPEDFDQQMKSIYFSAVYMTRSLAATIPRARIINVVSSSALTPSKNSVAYGAAKAAEMHFFQSLQKEFKPETYQITNLYPKDIATTVPDPNAIDPTQLAAFIRNQAQAQKSYYLRDVTIYPLDLAG